MKKILAIDDDIAPRDAYEMSLTDHFQVILAVDGVDGLEKFHSTNPDLIFLDLRMPKLDGVEVLTSIRESGSNVPIYIVTAFSKEYMQRLEEVREKGFEFEVASKPLTPDQIRSIAFANLEN